jgi:rubrerythrin
MTDAATTKYSFRELGGLDRLDVDALRSLFTIELGGEDFYNGLADRIVLPEAAELLRRSGREEAGHARRVLRAISITLGSAFEPSPDMLERTPVHLPDTIDPAVFERLVQGELAGDAAYQRWADSEPDEEVARLLRLNGREETIHAHRIEAVLALLNG